MYKIGKDDIKTRTAVYSIDGVAILISAFDVEPLARNYMRVQYTDACRDFPLFDSTHLSVVFCDEDGMPSYDRALKFASAMVGEDGIVYDFDAIMNGEYTNINCRTLLEKDNTKVLK